jgi:tetratricopeptide (TPR) repeat protein
VKEYLEAIRLEEGNPYAYINLGDALLALGRDDEALAAYQRALGLKPDSAGSCYGIGVILGRKGRTAEAVQYLRQAESAAMRLGRKQLAHDARMLMMRYMMEGK